MRSEGQCQSLGIHISVGVTAHIFSCPHSQDIAAVHQLLLYKMHRKMCSFCKNSWKLGRRKISVHSKVTYQRVVLGIETSCDDTGAALVDENGKIRGEALLSQKEVHLKTGGIIPSVAQQLHKDNIDRVVNEAVLSSGISLHDVSAIATTVKPGLALSLGVGLSYSLNLVKHYNKPFIPIHHMEAHALTIRLLHQVEFPFLVLLISGGHCILAVANGISDFLLLGQSLDASPGEALDKVARRLSLLKNSECSSMSGGQSIEYLAQFGIEKGELLSCAADIATSVQHSVAHHLVKRTQRAILYCKQERLLPSSKAALVVSGGVASNEYIRKMLQNLTDDMDMSLLCPPPNLCTDNGVMIAWNGVEKLRIGAGVLKNTDGIRYEPRALFGIDISEQVRNAAIKLPRLRNKK
ncbi:tRNA N6-adenosine threonylcarbamoyltransferase, mitochondrial isoform X3 [Rhinoderma darwinii]|uniref:tRNA N6-adenosine threonylcarbamoyltransferase, mitochondrial isoform X3 n=1 Tax=Rhinoderma darwinii TaxID=43563 RepID=UPI003F675629